MGGLLEYPKQKCSCGSTDFWYAGNNEWTCMRCHPTADDKKLLWARAIICNRKLYLAWFNIQELPRDLRSEKWAEYEAAREKAKDLARQLKERGMTECLYVENGKKVKKCNVFPKITAQPSWEGFFCNCCPNDFWWEQELLTEDRKLHPEAWDEQ